MGYVSQENGNSVTIDAILTDKGREYLAKGMGLPITQYTLADDEINYQLYNPSHLKGTDYYGVAIQNMPVLEAFPDSTQSMKYKLVTMPKNTTVIPYISISATPSIENGAIVVENEGTTTITVDLMRPTTQVGVTDKEPNPGTFTYTILDTTFVTFNASRCPAMGSCTLPGYTSSVMLMGRNQNIAETKTNHTKLIITNDTTGARYVIPITIKKKSTTV